MHVKKLKHGFRGIGVACGDLIRARFKAALYYFSMLTIASDAHMWVCLKMESIQIADLTGKFMINHYNQTISGNPISQNCIQIPCREPCRILFYMHLAEKGKNGKTIVIPDFANAFTH